MRSRQIKNFLLAFVIAMVLVVPVLIGSKALAGGDKVRGDKGAGSTTQECINFGQCPYGDYDPYNPFE